MLIRLLYRFMANLFALYLLEEETADPIAKLVRGLRDQRAEKRKALDEFLTPIEAENRNLTEDETTALAEHRAELARFDERIADLEEMRTAELRAAEAAANAGPASAGTVTVRSEPLTYQRGDNRQSYFRDLGKVLVGGGDSDAQRRLERHATEVRERAEAEERANPGLVDGEQVGIERRDLNRTDGTGGYFVPPAWMVDEFIALARASRPTADLMNRRPLPPGTDSINLPKVSTGTATAIQTADNATVQETDLADTSISLPVRTVAGQQDVALQLLDQSPIAFDEVVFADLAADHATKVDVQVISGSGSSGQVVGLRTVTSVDTTAYTDGSPTVPELYPKVADSLNEIATNRFLPAEVLLLHPRRWYWLLAALDSSNRPLVVPSSQGPNNALATFGQSVAEGAVGTMLGTPVVVDASIPTTVGGGTEDVIIATRPSDHWLFESAVRTRALPEVLSGTLTVRLQLYSYIAFTAERYPRSTSIVSGTGLAAPTF